MINKKPLLLIVLLILCLNFFTGCMSYSTLQTVETVPKGKVRLGVGAVVFVDGSGLLPEIGMRAGAADNFDLGLKYSLPDLFVVDAKYQFLKSDIDASVDLGWSYYSHDHVSLQGYYPMLLVGQKHWYFGVKGNYFSSTGNIDLFGNKVSFNGSGYFGTSIVTGAVIGNEKAKLLLELNTFLFNSGKPLYVPGAGIYLDF